MNFSVFILIEGRNLIANMLNQGFQGQAGGGIADIQDRVSPFLEILHQSPHGTPGAGDPMQNHDIIHFGRRIRQT